MFWSWKKGIILYKKKTLRGKFCNQLLICQILIDIWELVSAGLSLRE